MKILLDTHAFLWWVADDPQISANAKDIISNPDNEGVAFAIVEDMKYGFCNHWVTFTDVQCDSQFLAAKAN